MITVLMPLPDRSPIRTGKASQETFSVLQAFRRNMSISTNVYLKPPPSMLVVEDSNEDFEAFRRYLQRSPLQVPLHRCTNGDQALAFLYQRATLGDQGAPRPGLIIIDLNLPGTDGREVLRRIKQDERLKTIPIIVFTTSNNPRDIEECYRLGVNSYIVKPININQLKRDIQLLVDYWFEVTTLPGHLEG